MASTGEEQQRSVPTSATETPTTTPIENLDTNLSMLPTSTTTTTTTTTSSSCVNGRKRPFDHFELLQSSPYFKIRVVANDLRSLFLEVIRAPDIQNCDAAQGIQEKLKLLQDLCRQKATVENIPTGIYNSGDRIQETGRAHAKPAEERRGNNLEKPECNKISGTYIVGGSAFGWNFIMFQGTRPEYYGRTKEEFRAGK